MHIFLGWERWWERWEPDRPTGPDQTGATSAEQRLPIKVHEPRFGTNEHPRRDTDVILRQSKAPLELFKSR